nr:unnamed protein product [Naegleria fowleri]
MSSHLLDPFKTPTKRQPATFVTRHLGATNNNPPQATVWTTSTSQQQPPDQELSFVDDLLEVHDDDSLLNQSIHLDQDAPPTPKHETPCYVTHRLTEKEITQSSHTNTVLELSKLISYLQSEDHGRKGRNFSVDLSHQMVLLFVVLVALFGVWMASSYRPFCSSSSSWYPCRQCPPHAVCSTFRIESCYQSPNAEFNYTIHENGQLCIRNDSTGLLSYQLSVTAKDYLENLAYKVDCLGKANVTKKVSRHSMEDYLVSYLVAHSYDHYGHMNHPEQQQHIGVDSTFTHAFNTMLELFEENEYLYRIAVEGDYMHSYRFQSSGSCLLAKQHFQRFTVPKEQYLTVVESDEESSTTVSPATTLFTSETTTTPTNEEIPTVTTQSSTSNIVNEEPPVEVLSNSQTEEEALPQEEIF